MVNTISTYRSPLRIIAHTAEDISNYSTQAISRARKKMMAEITLAGDELVIDGIGYSRNDAATLLDNISEDDWRLHHSIWMDAGLLNFLERNEFDAAALQPARALRYNPRFAQAVSPYFSYSFNVVSGRLLKAGDFDGLRELLAYQSFVLPEHSHDAFQKLRTYFDDLSYTLRNLSWEKFQGDESVLHFVFSESWQSAVNSLPSSFATVRDDIVEQVIGIVIRFQHKATWYYLHRVLQELGKLEMNDFNRSEIERIDKVIYANSQAESRAIGAPRSGDGLSVGRIIWWGIWLVLIIVRVATCADNKSKSGNDYLRSFNSPGHRVEQNDIRYAFERQNENRLVSFLDSFSTAGGLPVVPQPLKTGDQPFVGLAKHPSIARNDSVNVINCSGHDVVLLYCKDFPGHHNSGYLPMMYATFIKSGEQELVSVEPENGRIYVAFGDNWGQLKEPLRINMKNTGLDLAGNNKAHKDFLLVSHFFGKPAKMQILLQSPLKIGYAAVARPTTVTGTTAITLLATANGLGVKSNAASGGRLTVERDF